MNNTKFSYYSGNIKLSKSIGLVTIEQFIRVNLHPMKRTLDLLQLIKSASAENNIKLKRELKQKLYSFTPSVIINEGYSRRYINIVEWSGLMQIDLDKIETEAEAKEIKEHIFNNNKEIVCAMISPSGKGVKCLMKIDKPSNLKDYKAMHKAMVKIFECYNYLDEATNNGILPMFLTADMNILYRNINECDTWIKRDNTVIEYKALNSGPQLTYKNDYSTKDKTIRIFKNKIENILDNGHPQLRSACLILGSRVSANYIDKIEALSLAKNLITSNSYLQKDLDNYIKTAEWAIDNGMKCPKYY